MNEQMIQEFRQRLSDGQKVIGPFMKTCDPAFVEAAGWAGMDFVILDMEHGPISVEHPKPPEQHPCQPGSRCFSGRTGWQHQ